MTSFSMIQLGLSTKIEKPIPKMEERCCHSHLVFCLKENDPKEMTLLGGVALLEQMWSCWSKYVSGEEGFEVSCMVKPF